MKKLIFAFIIMLSVTTVIKAQDNNDGGGMLKSSGDRFSVDFFSDMWQTSADTNFTIKGYNPGFNASYFFNLPLSGKFSIGLGLGLGAHNMNSNAMPYIDSLKNTRFYKIPDTALNGVAIDYDINKLTLAYLDIPLEFRFTTTNKNGKKIKIAIGAKGGYLVNNHTKYKGSDFADGNEELKYKRYKIANLESLRYGATFRLGYDKYHLFGYYSLSKIFKKDKGPEMYPISVGIGIAM